MNRFDFFAAVAVAVFVGLVSWPLTDAVNAAGAATGTLVAMTIGFPIVRQWRKPTPSKPRHTG